MLENTFSLYKHMHAHYVVNSPVGGYMHGMLFSQSENLEGNPLGGSLGVSLTKAHLAGPGV